MVEEERLSLLDEDRLSILPDELILRILSFVDAESAIQTCVLSKRWKYLWTSTPALNFNDYFFRDISSFESFVDHALSCRDNSSLIRRLTFNFSFARDVSVVKSITEHALHASLEDISFCSNDDCIIRELPRLFACRFLTTLTMEGIKIKTSLFELSNLKKMELFSCRFCCGDQDVIDIFSSCDRLRCLYLEIAASMEKFSGLNSMLPSSPN